MMGRSNVTAMEGGDLDLHAVGQALWRRKLWIIGPTVLVALIAAVAVNLITPRYKSEARLLYDGRENVFLRPEAERATTDRAAADQEALASQVQLILSRELALQVIGELKLGERPEFDPLLGGLPLYKRVTVFLGISRDPYRMTPEERVLEAYYERLNAYAIEKSRVIALEFQSSDPVLAAMAANTVAQGYMKLQQSAKQEEVQAASRWLSNEIERLRRTVAEAEARVEDFRAKTDLYVGTNNTMLSNQQLGEFNSQLATARAQKSDAETRARLIRDMLHRGDSIEASEIVNSESLRRLSDQRALLRAQLAEQSSTLLDGHPRIKELKALISDLDRQIRAEAEKLVRTLENDARITGARVEALSTNLATLKRQAAVTNEDDVRLRALERDAKSQRDLLETYLARYREASARETIGSGPPDARVISRAVVSNTPFFPKKLPLVLIATLATLVAAVGISTASELMRIGVPARHTPMLAPVPAALPIMAGPFEPLPNPFAQLRDRLRQQRSAAVPDATVSLPPSAERTDLAPGATPPSTTPADHEPAEAAAADGRVMASADEVAHRLREIKGGRVALFAASSDLRTTPAALALTRLLARDALVVLVRLGAAPDGDALDSDGPGIADMIRGDATFGEIIVRDKVSRAHLVPRGGDATATADLLRSLRFETMIDALARTYDYVVIDAGACDDIAVEAVAELAPIGVLVAAEATSKTTLTAQSRLAKSGYPELMQLVGSPLATPALQPEPA